jgi:adenine-specific DNA glycosylase
MSAWIPSRTPSHFNQGMMELGAQICVPFKPHCRRCPVRIFCRSKKLGIENSIPGIRKKRSCERIRIVTLILEQGGSILLARQSGRNLMPGDWGLPWQFAPNRAPVEEIALNLCRAILGYGIRLKSCPSVRHAISNRQITALGFYGKPIGRAAGFQTGGSSRWVRRSSAKKLLISSLFVKILDKSYSGEQLNETPRISG